VTACVNLDKQGRVPTVRVNTDNISTPITFMLDTESGPNLIKENFIHEKININYTQIY